MTSKYSLKLLLFTSSFFSIHVITVVCTADKRRSTQTKLGPDPIVLKAVVQKWDLAASAFMLVQVTRLDTFGDRLGPSKLISITPFYKSNILEGASEDVSDDLAVVGGVVGYPCVRQT
ncbi:hypothetical protein RB195_013977 [Necator americanus]|uniref:Transthyretin-like family protein n=1 Tax=Necator americanus TaxID=51031 RepID=A0ABR1DY09_NECAM